MLPDSAEQRSRDTGLARGAQASFDVVLHALIAVEVAIDEIRSLVRCDAELLSQAERCLTVDDPKVYCFGALTLFRGNGVDGQSKHLRRGAAMDVLTCSKRGKET